MKKIIFTTILLSFLTACNVDNVESDLIPVSGTEVDPSNTDCFIDVNNPPSITGTTWLRTSVVIETPIDGNNDGVFSTELEGQYTCSADPLVFSANFTVGDPQYNNFMLKVIDDGNGNLMQQVDCLIGDGIFPIYTQEQNTVNFCYSGELDFTATLSNNEQTLTFNLAYEDFFFATNKILNADGTVTTYQGGITIVYTRQ